MTTQAAGLHRASRFLGRMAVAGAWVFGVLLVAWNVLRVYPGDIWKPVRLLNYFAPWLLIPLLLGLVIAMLGKRPWLAGLTAGLILVLGARLWVPNPQNLLQASSESGVEARPLRVMTFNVHYRNRNARGIAEMIRSEQPDVVAFQEFSRELAAALYEEIGNEYPHFLPDHRETPRLALVSRYPLEEMAPEEDTWRTQRAVLHTPDGPVLVWNVHSSPSITQWGWKWQKATLTALAGHVAQEPGPQLVLGDFNTTDQSENYRLVAGQLHDVHRVVGRWFGFTFPDTRCYLPRQPNLGPAIRIDYVFVSHHWLAQEIHVVADGRDSDHRPVVATLRLGEH